MYQTQYIAPLRAEFDLSLSQDSKIRMVETDDELSVQWLSLYMKGRKEMGPFTFQVCQSVTHQSTDMVKK